MTAICETRIGPGYHFGHLTVKGKTDRRCNGYVVWICQCDCGNEIEMDTRKIQRESQLSCTFCHPDPLVKEDLQGKKYGKLTVLEPVLPTLNRIESWKCKCECGNEVLIAANLLENGKVKSCGCLHHPPIKDWIGKRFGRLTVTGYTGKEGGIHRWTCKCDCGNTTVVGQTLLQSGKTRSCGCLRKETLKDNLRLVDGTSVTRLESRDRPPIQSNTSGHTGVYWNRRSSKWIAQITFKRKTYYLGSFTTLDDAVNARKKGEEMYSDFLDRYYKRSNLENVIWQ